MPAVYHTDNSFVLSKEAAKLIRRDDEDDGGLKTSTKVGIAIGLISFVTILVSFWLIWRYRRKPRALTEDDIFAQETYHRWEENILSGGRASESNDHPARRDSGHTRRASASTLETYTGMYTPTKADLDLPQPQQALPQPQQAHLATHL